MFESGDPPEAYTKTVECPRCHGTRELMVGDEWPSKPITCPRCDGSGEVEFTPITREDF